MANTTLANEEIAITNLDPVETATAGRFAWGVNDAKPVASQVVPIVGGAAACVLVGFAVCHFIVEPLIAKKKAAKAAAATAATVEEKAEEPKKEEE